MIAPPALEAPPVEGCVGAQSAVRGSAVRGSAIWGLRLEATEQMFGCAREQPPRSRPARKWTWKNGRGKIRRGKKDVENPARGE